MREGDRIDYAALTLPPPPAFPPPGLFAYANSLRENLQIFLQDVPHTHWIGVEAAIHIAAIRQHFDLPAPEDDRIHALALPDENWARFHEPQITGGLAWYLDAENHAARRGRVQAFLRAASGRADLEIATVELVAAEHGVKRNVRRRGSTVNDYGRIDLLVIGRTSAGQRHAAIIEAKFGHVLTRGQLDIYNHAVRNDLYGLDGPDTGSALVNRDYSLCADTKSCAFVVVAPTLTTQSAALLRRKENRHWSFLSWDRLLTCFETHLAREDVEHDSDAFRRFRRVLWTRAYFE